MSVYYIHLVLFFFIIISWIFLAITATVGYLFLSNIPFYLYDLWNITFSSNLSNVFSLVLLLLFFLIISFKWLHCLDFIPFLILISCYEYFLGDFWQILSLTLNFAEDLPSHWTCSKTQQANKAELIICNSLSLLVAPHSPNHPSQLFWWSFCIHSVSHYYPCWSVIKSCQF